MLGKDHEKRPRYRPKVVDGNVKLWVKLALYLIRRLFLKALQFLMGSRRMTEN